MSFDPAPWIGRTEQAPVRAVRETVGMLEASLDRPAPPAGGAVLEPLRHWLWLFAPPPVPTSALGPDGHPPRGTLVPDWPLPRRMWAGSTVDFHEPVPLDTVMTRHSTLESATVKGGRSGTLGFAVLRHRWLLPDGRCAIDDAQTVVYREPAPSGASNSSPARSPSPAPASPAAGGSRAQPSPTAGPAAAWEVTHRPDAPLLFRYSALTFNTHRIHYDLPYTTGEEGYPGLVVHGPLMATLMLDAFRDAHPRARVRRFSFRALAPAFAGASIRSGGLPDGEGRAKLWVRAEDGGEHLSGEVSFE